MGGNPDIELVEADLQPLSECTEEIAVFRHIGHIDEEAGEVVPIDHTVLFPFAAQRLGFSGSGTVVISQFCKSLHEQRGGDSPPVVKPQRYQYLEAT